jgi:peptide-methionine (S)-S-oxide reductase
MAKAKATIGGGCFWCIEAVYDELTGVEDVVSGYAGGHVPNPTYKQVCTEQTGHAEVVQITFDNMVISYRDILDVFFTVHDPTTLNQQGPDFGAQYRSIILYHSPEQAAAARDAIEAAAKLWDDPIVTEVVPLDVFYPAEDYHQEYYVNNPDQPYCRLVVRPKVNKFRSMYLNRLKAQPHG